MPVAEHAPDAQRLRFKMRISDATFSTEHGGWLSAGDIIVVDEDTALRWLDHGIAEQAGRDEKTAAEIRREKLRARLVAMDEDEIERAERSASARKTPAQPPRRRGRSAVPPKLVGAGVINSLDDGPDDIGDEGEDD